MMVFVIKTVRIFGKFGDKKRVNPVYFLNGLSRPQDIANCLAKSFSAACSHNSIFKNEELSREFLAEKSEYVLRQSAVSNVCISDAFGFSVTLPIPKDNSSKVQGRVLAQIIEA